MVSEVQVQDGRVSAQQLPRLNFAAVLIERYAPSCSLRFQYRFRIPNVFGVREKIDIIWGSRPKVTKLSLAALLRPLT